MAKKVVVYIAQQAIEDLGKSKCYVNATPSTNRSKATVVVSDERVFTESEVDELIKAGNAMSVAMYQYQMDVDDDPPQKHRDMMHAWEAAVRRLSDPA